MKNFDLSKIATLTATTVLGLGLLAACAPRSTDLQSPPEPGPVANSASAEISAPVSITPKVDILFVIDTSDSMLPHQERLKANLDRFVDAFKQHADVDFHIGAASIYDDTRYNVVVPEPYPLGKLRPLKDPANPSQNLPEPWFVSMDRFKDIGTVTSVLKESLKIGIEPRFKYTLDAKGNPVYDFVKDASGNFQKDAEGRRMIVDGGGPENEELFNVIEPATLRNAGFYRADAHLAIIMLTDADDGSKIQPDNLKSTLINMKKGDPSLVSAYAALALSDKCPKDPGLRAAGGVPKKIMSLVSLLGGKTMDLCDNNYGDRLAEVGRLIQQKASQVVHVRLQSKPGNNASVKVMYNGKPVDSDNGKAWYYDDYYVQVVIHGDHPSFASKPGGKVEISYLPLSFRDAARGRVIPVN